MSVNTRSYRLRLVGLPEPEGKIKLSRLCTVFEAFRSLAERSTRLMLTGTGKGKDPKPSWLKAAIDFTVAGLSPGSTVFDLEAPCLRDTAGQQLSQVQLWRDSPRPDDTAIDLAAYAIEEIRSGDSSSKRIDGSVLQAILKLGKAGNTKGLIYQLDSRDEGGAGFVLDERICQQINEFSESVPEPQAWIVSGRLNEIRHNDSSFRLDLPLGSSLTGKLDSDFLDQEALRPLWGKRATVEGIVQFKGDGRPRLISARRVLPRSDGDDVFEQFPTQRKLLDPAKEQQAIAFDPNDLAGLWPGNESIEELLDLLD